MAQGQWKLTRRHENYIIQRACEGAHTSAIRSELESDRGVVVHPETIRYYRRKHAELIARSLQSQLREAVAVSSLASLEGRLQVLESIIEAEVASERPNRRLILESVKAAGDQLAAVAKTIVLMREPIQSEQSEVEKEREFERAVGEFVEKQQRFASTLAAADRNRHYLTMNEDEPLRIVGAERGDLSSS